MTGDDCWSTRYSIFFVSITSTCLFFHGHVLSRYSSVGQVKVFIIGYISTPCHKPLELKSEEDIEGQETYGGTSCTYPILFLKILLSSRISQQW